MFNRCLSRFCSKNYIFCPETDHETHQANTLIKARQLYYPASEKKEAHRSAASVAHARL